MSLMMPIVVCNMNMIFCPTEFCEGPFLFKRDWLNFFNANVNSMTGSWLIEDQGGILL